MSIISIWKSIVAWLKQLFSPAKFAMIGDSIFANLVTTNTQGALPSPWNTALNLAVHGTTSAQIAASATKVPGSVKTLLIDGGGNDVFIAIASNIMSQAVIDSIYNNYASMINAIPRSTHVLLLGIAHIDEVINGPDATAQFALVNARLNTLGTIFPNVTVLTDAQNVSMVGLTIDGVHPSSAGYAALFAKIPAL
jgi:lysophospholipase L1-like esterase